jgi:hypothetical protein
MLRPDDVVIVTFPRSGTNWTSFLVANALVHGREESPTLADFRRVLPGLNGEYFEGRGWAGWRLRVSYRKLPSPRIFSVHAPYDPSFPKVVYVVRDPRDVLVSNFHFQRLVGRDRGAAINEYVMGTVSGADQWPCPWDAHVRDWALSGHPNVIVISYEELHEDPARALARILDFAGVDRPQAAVEAAVQAASFERMRAHEETTGLPPPIQKMRADEQERFIRRGRRGAWQDELDEECVWAIESAYGETMTAMGYVLSASPRSPELAAQ